MMIVSNQDNKSNLKLFMIDKYIFQESEKIFQSFIVCQLIAVYTYLYNTYEVRH